MRFHDLKVETVQIEEIDPHPQNANNGDIDAIEESLEVNGFYKPILVQASSGYILVGNHTYAAALRQRAATVPVIYLDVDDLEAKRIMVADNSTNRKGFDDEALLAPLLQELFATDPGLHGTGYDGADMRKLMQELEEPLAFDPSDALPSHDAPDKAPKAALKVSVVPILEGDSEVYEISVTREGSGPFSKSEYQAVRRALGLEKASNTELRALGVDGWH